MDANKPLVVFFHKLCFIFARSILIVGFPVLFLKGGAMVRDNVTSPDGYILILCSFIIPSIPAYLMKYVFRLSCPYCKKGKLDKELIGSSDYQCLRCRKFWS